MSVSGPNSSFLTSNRARSAAPLLAAPILAAGDTESTRIVYGIVIGLALIGVLLVGLAIWLIRQTRVDLEVLAPLERMGDREWRKSDPASQRRTLDETRPEGAQPLQPEQRQPRVDTEFEKADRPVQSFDDLTPIKAEGGDPTPLDAAALQVKQAQSSVDLEAGDQGGPASDSRPDDPDAAEAPTDTAQPAEQ